MMTREEMLSSMSAPERESVEAIHEILTPHLDRLFAAAPHITKVICEILDPTTNEILAFHMTPLSRLLALASSPNTDIN